MTEDQNKPVTRAEIEAVVSSVIIGERHRLAGILTEMRGESMEIIAEAVANDDAPSFDWPK